MNEKMLTKYVNRKLFKTSLFACLRTLSCVCVALILYMKSPISHINIKIERLKNTTIGANKKTQEFLESHGSSTLKTGSNLAEILCRPEMNYEILSELDENREPLPIDVIEQVEIEVKYEGYIKRQISQVNQYKKMEEKTIPLDIDYDDVQSLRKEARQKLKQMKPINVGQASRISGVSPADISVLLVYLEHKRNR